jgi:flagellar biogenesis protein FliO
VRDGRPTTTDLRAAYAVKLCALALALGALYLLARRLRERRTLRCITVMETAMLSPQVAVHLLRVGGRHVLIASGSGGATTLAQWSAAGSPSDVEVAELREFVAGGLD